MSAIADCVSCSIFLKMSAIADQSLNAQLITEISASTDCVCSMKRKIFNTFDKTLNTKIPD